jgi:putative transposase
MKQGLRKKGRKRKKAKARERKRYTSDLSLSQWERIKPLIPLAKPNGRPRETNIRAVLNGIFYRLKNGCTWDNLPKDFPPSKTVYHYFRQWSLDGLIEEIHDVLRRAVRVEVGKTETPTAGCIDSQSVKTTQKGATEAMTPVKRLKAGSDTFA